MRQKILVVTAGLLAGILFSHPAEAVKVRRGSENSNETVSSAVIQHVEVQDIPAQGTPAHPAPQAPVARVTEEPAEPLAPAEGRLEALIDHILRQERTSAESTVATVTATDSEQAQREQIEDIMKSIVSTEPEMGVSFKTVPVPIAKNLL